MAPVRAPGMMRLVADLVLSNADEALASIQFPVDRIELVRRACAANVPLPPRTLKDIRGWFSEIVREEKRSVKSELMVEAGVKVKSGIPFLGSLFGKFSSAISAGSEHALSIRARLKNFPDDL